MAENKSNRLKNTIKSPAETEDQAAAVNEKKVKEKKGETDRKSVSVPLRERIEARFAFLKNEKFQRISGLLFILISIYLTVAFTSYIFTWAVDQDKVLGSWSALFSNNDLRVDNWLGKFGAIISHQFFYKWFGVSSFIIAVLFLIAGLRLFFKYTLMPLNKALSHGLFLLLWFSLTFGIFFHDKLFFLGGGTGFHLSSWFTGIVGYAGTVVFIFFAFISYLVLAFNFSFKPSVEGNVENEIKAAPSFEDTRNIKPEEELIEIKEIRQKEISVSNNIKSQVPVNPLQEENDDFSEEQNEDDEEDIPAEALILELKTDSKTNNVTPESLSVQEEPEETEETEEYLAIEEQETIEPALTDQKGTGDIQFEVENSVQDFAPKDSILGDLTAEPETADMPFGEYDPTLDLSSYKFPEIDLLEQHGSDNIKVNNEELQANKNRILETLRNYSIDISKIKATIGPTVTLYEIVPAPGVRISKIKNLEDDIALSLSALGIRIIAPIPGKGTIGIEVPNQNAEVVSMRSILNSEKFQNTNMELPVALGKTISNEIFIADLAKMPHLLMAGATGQGKSVGLNAILVSLLYKKHPSQVKFVLVDPKKVELTLYTKIERHFLAKLPDSADAIITDNKKVIHTLNSLCIEMDNRYELLKDAQVRNIKEYNAKFINRRLNPNNGHRFLPYIVLVVDEFADLIMTAGKEVETPIARLAQLARAIGIHLIIATQRPSVNIITGTIKANFPARIAFRVTSKIDSRTILDSGGADQLIGRGDMLLSTGNDLIRIQCAFVDTPEVEKITDFIGSQRGYPSAHLLPEYIDETASATGEDIDMADRDALFDEAARIIVQHQQGSASLLQRRLKLGYNRAGRIIDQLEAAGIIGPFEGSKAREVLVKDPMSLEQFLTKRD